MRKRRLEKQSQGETLLGWDRAHGKGRDSLVLSIAIPGFSQDGVFNLGEITLLFLHTAVEGYDSKLPFKRGFRVHFPPSFLPFFSFSSLVFCVLLLFSFFCSLSVSICCLS